MLVYVRPLNEAELDFSPASSETAGVVSTARNFLTRPSPARRDALAPERGPSDSSTFPEEVGGLFCAARIERPPLYRGGSASKKNGLPSPSHQSEAARCASTEDDQAPFPPTAESPRAAISHLGIA
jgi:hypothetical protein